MADNCCAAACGRTENLNRPEWRRALWIALFANGTMFLVEMVAGVVAGSRSLQADALDFFGDAANYAVSLGVAGMAIGWRARTALIKGMTIFGFALGVLCWAIWGLIAGSDPEPIAMSAVGALALLVNLSVAVMLFRFRSGDANMQSVWVCSRNDAINNVVVIGAGVAVMFTGSGLPDLLAAFIMAAIGLHGGWQIISQARRELGATRASA